MILTLTDLIGDDGIEDSEDWTNDIDRGGLVHINDLT